MYPFVMGGRLYLDFDAESILMYASAVRDIIFALHNIGIIPNTAVCFPLPSLPDFLTSFVLSVP